MFSYCKKTLYRSDILQNNKLAYNSYIPCQFKNYIGFQNYAVISLNNVAFQMLKTSLTPSTNFSKFKSVRKKLFKTQFRFWLNDFYLDNKNFNTKYSFTMIQCSKYARLEQTNF